MLGRYWGLPFPVALGLLAGLTVAGVGIAFALGDPPAAIVAVAPVAVLAGLYLYGYAQRPGPETPAAPPLDPTPTAGATAPGPVEEEPFEDPVEEADRADSERAVSETAPTEPPEG